MESKIDYSGMEGHQSQSSTQYFTSRYIRHSKSVGILWGVFTVCSAILNIVVFMSASWVGDTKESKGPGHFGLWRFCTVLSPSGSVSDPIVASSDPTSSSSTYEDNVICIGDLNNFASILSPAFRASTVFVGLSVIVILLCVVAFILFCFMKSGSVFEICGTMQFLSGICLAIGILSFPAGWDNAHVRSICGSDADDYSLGDCGVRWAFVLAIIAFFDCWILGCLAFTLAHREVRPGAAANMENHYANPQSIYKGEYNSGFIGDNQSLTGSRKSLNLQPVMMMPHPPPPPHHQHPDERYSEIGPRIRSPNSPYNRNSYNGGGGQQSIQNFQL